MDLNSSRVLVAQPVSPHKNFDLWRKNAQKIFDSLTFPNKTQGVLSEEVSAEGGQFAKHARARNKIIEKYLTDDITHVLWFDADVVVWPNDIIEKLIKIDEGGVVAPYVYIEENEWWPFRRFYDISCFRDLDGREFDFKPPFYNQRDGDTTTEVACVGTVFLVPARFHRSIRYDPYFGDNEHIYFFNEVRKAGGRVMATPEVEVHHAFLPKYGESFH